MRTSREQVGGVIRWHGMFIRGGFKALIGGMAQRGGSTCSLDFNLGPEKANTHAGGAERR